MSKNYKVTKGKAMPKSVRCYGAFCPFSEMEEGDSFTFAICDEARVRQLADSYGKRNKVAFAIAYSEDDGTVWRIR